ncbi:MAG: RNA polymerase sigma factor [Planctomycetota bacterium]|nr:RNA polymerase sigma factor [Planctomycetota bacterium]
MNRGELETLIRMHQAEIYRYLRYLGADETTAEDLTQDTFLALLRRPKSPTPASAEPRSQAAWLRGIARNLFLMHCRRARTERRHIEAAALAEAESFWENEFLRGGDGFEVVEALRHCLQKVTQAARQVLDMFYREERSRAEIARACQMSEDGVKSLLRRTRAELAECIQRRLQAEGRR